MSVIGIDLGNCNTVVAVARNKGVDIILNDVSNRLTPTLVSFASKCREIGESAKSIELSNFKNTISCFKRLIGRRYDDPILQENEFKFLNFTVVPDEQGMVACQVDVDGKLFTYSMVQILAMYFGKLKEIIEVALDHAKVRDCVISVPGYFLDNERRALIDAAEIAGLNVLRLFNETASSSLAYGISRSDFSETEPIYACFVDIGHASASVSIVSYMKGKLEVKGSSFNPNFGGRNFDDLLRNYFVKEFASKYKITSELSKKSFFRLLVSCEKAKRILSANTSTSLSVENYFDGNDVSTIVTRELFETLSADLLNDLDQLLETALSMSGLSISDVSTIEVVGGTTRIPSIQNRISSFFKRNVSFNLNQDEAVARGCAIQCAMLSPSYKVREFSVNDMVCHGYHLSWEPTKEEPNDTDIEIFPQNFLIPSTKLVTFERSTPFDILVNYRSLDLLPYAPIYPISKFTINNVTPTSSGKPSIVKVKVRVNPNSIFVVEDAYIQDDVEAESSQNVNTGGDAMTDDPEVKQSVDPSLKKKKVIKTHLPVTSYSLSLPRSTISDLVKIESNLVAMDKLYVATQLAKNSLEQYIYEMKSKIDGELSVHFLEVDKSKFRVMLSEYIDWLYGAGFDVEKDIYISKLNELQVLGEPAQSLFNEYELFKSNVSQFKDTCSKLISNALSNDSKYDHISSEEKSKINSDVNTALVFLNEQMEKVSSAPKHLPSPIAPSSIRQELEKLVQSCTSILNRSKPVPATNSTETSSSSEKTEASQATVDVNETEMDL